MHAFPEADMRRKKLPRRKKQIMYFTNVTKNHKNAEKTY